MHKLILTFLFCLCTRCSSVLLQTGEEHPAGAVIVEEGKTAPLEQKQCLNGDAKICYQIGVRYQKAIEVKMAFKFFEIGCNLDHADSCFEAGKLKEIYKAPIESELFFRKACRLKNGDACLYIAKLINSRKTVVKAVEMSEEEQEEQEEQGKKVEEKTNVQVEQEEFIEFKDQDSEVLSFLIQACDYKSPFACMWIGKYYNERKELENAFAFFLRACRLNLALGCYNAAMGKSKMGQDDFALEYFILACDKKNAESCYNLATFYAKKKQVDKGMHFLKLALEFGYQDWEKLETDDDLSNLRNRPAFVKLMELINSARNIP